MVKCLPEFENFYCIHEKIETLFLKLEDQKLQLLDTGGIGAVLAQVQSGEEKVIAYASRTLSKTQQRYCTTCIELLAVITFV